MSLPQVAATVAVALTAYHVKDAAGNRLIDETVRNGVLVLVVVTSILGPFLTERRRLTGLAVLGADDEI